MSPKKDELVKRLITPIFHNNAVAKKTPRINMEEISEPIYEEKTEIVSTTSKVGAASRMSTTFNLRGQSNMSGTLFRLPDKSIDK